MGIDVSEVSVVIPTRGDQDLTPIFDSLSEVGEIIVYNNGLEEVDYSVYARYKAIGQARFDVIVTQDDDCVLPPESIRALCEAYLPGVVATNMPERFRPNYPESALVGFGAVFDRELPERAFLRCQKDWFGTSHARWTQWDALFNRECDTVFTALTPRKLVDLPYEDLPWASAPGRLWTTPGHSEARARMLALVLAARDAVPT